MELQLSSLINRKPVEKSKKRGPNDSIALLKLASQREQSLALFHLIGKVMYNKRASRFPLGTPMTKGASVGKGDPPSSSATKREREQLRLFEHSIPDPEKLPSHLESHVREASLVDVNVRIRDRFDGACQTDLFGRRSMQIRRSTHLYFPYTCTRTIHSSVTSLKSVVTSQNG